MNSANACLPILVEKKGSLCIFGFLTNTQWIDFIKFPIQFCIIWFLVEFSITIWFSTTSSACIFACSLIFHISIVDDGFCGLCFARYCISSWSYSWFGLLLLPLTSSRTSSRISSASCILPARSPLDSSSPSFRICPASWDPPSRPASLSADKESVHFLVSHFF